MVLTVPHQSSSFSNLSICANAILSVTFRGALHFLFDLNRRRIRIFDESQVSFNLFSSFGSKSHAQVGYGCYGS